MGHGAWARLQTRGGEAVSLLGVKVTGDLRGLMFEACVEQRFVNPSQQNVELVYTFPLPWGAVLMGVDVLLGGKQLSGAVVEKREAEARYEEALSEGNAAIMLEKNRDHSYSLNLGNLAAGEHCTITLRYAQALQFEQRGLRLLIPTVLAPRYGNAEHDGGLQPHQVPSHSLTVEHGFELSLRVHGELARCRVASPSHPIGVARADTDAGSVLTVSLASQAFMDRDFVLVVDELAHESVAVAAQDKLNTERVAVMASFCPRLPSRVPVALAVKLLVDCSGSMTGDSIQAAKRALQAIVKQLDSGDRFSLSRFGSTVQHRSRGLWKAGLTTKLAAQRWVGALEADLGGTEMEAALSSTFALAQTVSSDVLLVTDGEIFAIDQTIEAAKHSGHRVFVVGIGSSPAESHLRRLAEATGGACDFVAPGEAVEPAVLRMFARLRSPRLSDLAIQWPEGARPQWMTPLPRSVFDGDTVNVYALFERAPRGAVSLVGQGGDEPAKAVGSAVLPEALEAADTLSRMAVSARLLAVAGMQVSSQVLDRARLAVDYQLVSEHTNFLLVHERADADKATDMPVLHQVAQMVPAGYGGAGTVMFSMRVAPASDMRWSSARVASDSYSLPSRRRVQEDASVDMADLEIPAFMRKQEEVIDHTNPLHWSTSAAYTGLTPLGACEWLHLTPASKWPASYIGLQQMGMGEWLVEWLELVMGGRLDAASAETQVVKAFLQVMSSQEVHEALAMSAGPQQALRSTLQRLRGDAVTAPAVIDMSLVEAMVTVLEDMTAKAWPQRMLSLDSEGDPFVGAGGQASIG
jgi:Ca-activated chloride channel homolog